MVKPQCLKRKNVAFLCICPISEGLRLPKTIFGVGPIFYHLQLSRQEGVVSAPLTSQSSHVFHFVACPQVDARQTRAPHLKLEPRTLNLATIMRCAIADAIADGRPSRGVIEVAGC
jgi:hypothetical protein